MMSTTCPTYCTMPTWDADYAMHFIVAKPAPDINRGAKCRVAPTQSCVIHNCLHDFNQLPLLNPKNGGGGSPAT